MGFSPRFAKRFNVTIMKEKTKYLLIGVIIGIIIGIAVFYLLMSLGIIRPFVFWNGNFARGGNFTNFTGPMRNASGFVQGMM